MALPCRMVITLLAATLAGCAERLAMEHMTPGVSAVEVQARAGPPTERRDLPGGVKAWYYEYGPLGWQTYRLRFDANDRLIDIDQMLTERHFRSFVAAQTTREEVLQTLGRPGLISRYPNLGEEVWTYRYREVTLEMLNDNHFDAASGVLKYYTMYRDPAYVSTGPH